MTKLFDYDEILKIFMIYNHINKEDCVFQFRLLFFKNINNNHEFLIINFIVIFDRIMLLEEVNNRI